MSVVSAADLAQVAEALEVDTTISPWPHERWFWGIMGARLSVLS